MNSLSWFIYLADVAASMQGLLTGITIISSILYPAAWVIYGLVSEMESDRQREAYAVSRRKVTRLAVTAFLIAAPLNVILPSKNTMYAIAASEIGERVSKTEIANDAVKAVHAWIKKQITEDKPK